MSYVYAEAWTTNEDTGEGLAVLEMSAEQAESFLSALGGIGKAIAPIAAQVLPVAAPIIGTAFGGPVGAMVGNMAGQYAGQALSGVAGGAGPAAPRPAASGRPGAPRLPAPPAPAANQLFSFLQNPQLLQSILGQISGGGGAVPVGASGAPAPFGAFMNALSVLANQAASESELGDSDESEDLPEYLLDARGRPRCDPAVPEERAAVLLQRLREVPVPMPLDPGGWLVSATRM